MNQLFIMKENFLTWAEQNKKEMMVCKVFFYG